MDEYIYDRQHDAALPFTGAILRALASQNEEATAALECLDEVAGPPDYLADRHFFDAHTNHSLRGHVYGQHFVEPVLHRIEDLMLNLIIDSRHVLKHLREMEKAGQLNADSMKKKSKRRRGGIHEGRAGSQGEKQKKGSAVEGISVIQKAKPSSKVLTLAIH